MNLINDIINKNTYDENWATIPISIFKKDGGYQIIK